MTHVLGWPELTASGCDADGLRVYPLNLIWVIPAKGSTSSDASANHLSAPERQTPRKD
jgi:hypothetical protein